MPRRFTRQDVVTFGIGLGVALLFTLGQALVKLDSGPVENWSLWAQNLGVGLAGAAGRYIVTEFTQRELAPEPPTLTVEDVDMMAPLLERSRRLMKS